MVASSTQNYADQAVNLSSEPCAGAAPQLKRKRSLLANFGPAGGSYHDISNT